MDDLIFELYNEIKNFRFVQKQTKDIEIIYSHISNFNRKPAEECASFYLQKYYNTLSRFGKITGGVRLVYDRNIYKKKTDIDVIDDLYFCIYGILCDAFVTVGFSKNIKDFVLTYFNN